MDVVQQALDFKKAREAGRVAAPVTSDVSSVVSDALKLRETRAAVKTPVASDTSSVVENALKLKAARAAGTAPPPAVPTGPIDQPTPSITQKPLRWLGAQLSKPGNILAQTTEPLANALVTGNISELGKIPGNIWNVASGKSTRGYLEMVQEAFPDSKIGGLIGGLGLSIIADPLNVIGGGLSKIGRLAEQVYKIEKAGQVINEGSKLWKTIQASGKTIEELRLLGAASKAEQAAAGVRPFLKAGDIPLVSAKTSEKIYKATSATSDVLGKIPIGLRYKDGGKEVVRLEELTSKVKGLFNTSTGNAAADRMIQHFKDLGEYRTAQVIEDAKVIQKTISKLPKEEIIQVSNFLEKGIIPDNPELHAIGEQLKKTYAEFAAIETRMGIAGEQVANYAPHINQADEKTMLGKAVTNFLSPKEWSTSMGYWEERTLQKFIGQNGHEVIGKATDLGLKPVANVKGLSRALTWGQFHTLKDVENVLKAHGFNLRLVPSKGIRVQGGIALGYFDPRSKDIVIAAGRDELDKIISTLKHEIVHGSQFQLAGNIDMYEDFSKTGKAWQRMKDALENGKNAVRKEWETILQHRNISMSTFKGMSPAEQAYYKEPTELLARVAQGMLEDPARAGLLYPESVKAFKMMQRESPMLNLLNTQVPALGDTITGQVFKDAKGNYFQMASGQNALSIQEANVAMKREFFKENPAVQLAYRGLANAKAVTSAEFLNGVKQFAVENGVESTAPELKGLLFEPGVAKQIDAYRKAVSPDEIGLVLKTIDSVQNWWKSQALFSFGYHTRNAMGNVWNNYLAGVTNPQAYIDAFKVQRGKPLEFVDDIGRKWTSESIKTAAEKSGVVNQGQFIGDIEQNVTGALDKGNFNPLSQENVLFRGNRAVGGAIENNARMANFITQLKKGLPVDDAAMEVKKFLFDYKDLTGFERNVMKRILPFYTFTRKNLPLQFEQMIKQPQKFAQVERVVQAAESLGMRGAPPANEKYISDYIRSNTAMKVNYNEKDKSYNYFLLGAWLPGYQAQDFLMQPLDNLLAMVSPLVKAPAETVFNKSAFWKDTLGSYQEIERVPGEQVNFLGLNMPKRTAQFLRNIRVLNDLDKANPGKIFGGVKGEKSIWAKAGVPAMSLPFAGNVSPSQFKYSPTGNIPDAWERFIGLMTGKLTSYKPTTARTYYNEETDKRVSEFKTLIKTAMKSGDAERVKLLSEQMNQFRKDRGI